MQSPCTRIANTDTGVVCGHRWGDDRKNRRILDNIQKFIHIVK